MIHFSKIMLALAIAERARELDVDAEIAVLAWEGMEAHLLEVRFARVFLAQPARVKA